MRYCRRCRAFSRKASTMGACVCALCSSFPCAFIAVQCVEPFGFGLFFFFFYCLLACSLVHSQLTAIYIYCWLVFRFLSYSYDAFNSLRSFSLWFHIATQSSLNDRKTEKDSQLPSIHIPTHYMTRFIFVFFYSLMDFSFVCLFPDSFVCVLSGMAFDFQQCFWWCVYSCAAV